MTLPKKLFVSNELEQKLLTFFIQNEFREGFWKVHRPFNHADYWDDVSVEISTNCMVGPSGFKSPCPYNFANPELLKLRGDTIHNMIEEYHPDIKAGQVKCILTQLSQIISGRLQDTRLPAIKAPRGTNLPDESDGINVLNSGFGLGGEWLATTNYVIEKMAEHGFIAKMNRATVTITRGSREVTLMLNGDNIFIISDENNIPIDYIDSPDLANEMVNRVITRLLTSNPNTVVSSGGITPRVINQGDTIVRRAPVVRPKVVAEAYSAANPFGMI